MVAIRDQRIDIGHGVEKVWRIVYDVRSDPALLMQTGYVRYDNNQVPVWRAYDPEDSRVKPGWRDGVWQNIHGLVMPNDPAATKIRYQATEYDVGNGELALLPKVEVKITYALREHLARVREGQA